MKKPKLLYLIMFTFLIPACLFAETFSFDTFTFDSDDEGNVWTFLPTTLKNVKKGDVYNVKLRGIPSDDIMLIDCGLEVETDDNNHVITIDKSEDEYYVKISHEMTKQHYISFIAAVKDNGYELTKLYPEGEAEARFKIERTQYIYYFCNHHGLFRKKII